jgi:Flp pilus assembly protein TadB
MVLLRPHRNAQSRRIKGRGAQSANNRLQVSARHCDTDISRRRRGVLHFQAPAARLVKRDIPRPGRQTRRRSRRSQVIIDVDIVVMIAIIVVVIVAVIVVIVVVDIITIVVIIVVVIDVIVDVIFD